jgi:hypothetical protein
MGIILAFLALHRFDPMGIEHRKYDRNQKNNDQPGECKILDQPKWGNAFFRGFGVHRQIIFPV